jgi:exopolysaccharide biosynthesis polyprenyl glycosylphosphotransferase
MLRRDRQLRTQVLQLRDSALFALALWLAHLWRASWPETIPWLDFDPIAPFDQFLWLYLIIIPMAPLVLESNGFYKRSFFCRRRVTAWLLMKSCVVLTVGVILVIFLFRRDLARMVIILFGGIGFVLVFLAEETTRAIHRARLGEGGLNKRVILVGTRLDTGRMQRQLKSSPDERLDVVGELDINENPIQQLVDLLHRSAANAVVIYSSHTYFGQVEQAIQACEREGVEAWLVADFFQTQVSRTTFDDFLGHPILVFRSAPEASWQGVFKQAIDFVLSLLLLALLGLPLLIVAAIIKITSPGPVLFRQQRAGLNGRPFTMLKFRSMVSDAEQRKQELALLNEMDGPVFKVTNDPRVTPIGRFIRKWSIDEFPQLLNVLRGEMSLVGPRPLPVDEVDRFDDPAHRRRLSVKPGLTCLWQVSGRNNVRSFQEWVRLDLEYIDNWSLWLDLKILWRTVPAVLAGTGAK